MIFQSPPILANKSYHVLNMTELEGHTFNKSADQMIAAVLITCVAVGVPCNIASLLYFWSRRKHSFPNVLYTFISAVDACTCVLTLPIICSLMNGRQPLGFFLSYTLCGVWYVPFYFTLRFSQFLVLVMSVTRTVNILAPFISIKKRVVLVACWVYAGYILTVKAVVIGFGVNKFSFFSKIASCTETNYVDPPDWKYMAFVMTDLANLILHSVIVFVSVVLSIMALAKGSMPGNDDFRRVSITITIFTAVFLVCNLPMFLAELLNNIVFVWRRENVEVAKSPFFVWYFILISYRVLIPVNAAVNPFIYFWRMESLRSWILDHLRKIKHPKTVPLTLSMLRERFKRQNAQNPLRVNIKNRQTKVVSSSSLLSRCLSS